jgi:hypothetical protein
MTLLTLFRYLFTGSPDAIRTIAASRGAIWVGLAFVLSAALAREYDGEYLPARPWVLAVPFAAAIGLATLLFVPIYLGTRGLPGADPATPRVVPRYRAFVALFLLTAPLAWLYAIPYERFLSPVAATTANLWTLAVVACWRVGLMARVLSVMTGRGFFPSLCAVMVIADVAVMVAMSYAPLPVLDFMGGLRQSERERRVASAAFLVQTAGLLSFFVWFFGALYWLFMAEGAPRRVRVPERRRIGRGVAVLAAASLAVWAAILPFTQREQRLRHEVEAQLAAGRVSEALAEMSRHGAGEFPPQWDPPPHVGRRGVRDENLLAVVEEILRERRPAWVEQVYAEKLERLAGSWWFRSTLQDESVVRERARRILELMPEAPPWRVARQELGEAVERVVPADDGSSSRPR